MFNARRQGPVVWLARSRGALAVLDLCSNSARGKRPGDMLGTLDQSIAIMGQRLREAELARADLVLRPKVLDIGPADFGQRAIAILEGEKPHWPPCHSRKLIAQLQAECVLTADWRNRRLGGGVQDVYGEAIELSEVRQGRGDE